MTDLLMDGALMQWAIEDVKPYAKNAKKHPDAQVKALAKQFLAHGFDQPLVVTPDGVLVKGHGRLLAATHAGFTTVPVIVRVGLTPAQVRAARIADNKLAETDWDMELVNEELRELASMDFDMDLTGFEFEQGHARGDGLTDEDDVPEVAQNLHGVERGQVFKLGRHRLMCGDSVSEDVATLMDGAKANMVFTDPPYGVDYDGGVFTKRKKLENDHDESIYAKVLPVLARHAADDAAFFIWFAISFSAAVSAAVSAAGLVERKTIIWNKNLAQFGAIGAQYKDKYEPCIYAHKKGKAPRWFGPTNEVSVWDVDRHSKNEFHPTQKPVALAERALANHTRTAHTVLDLFGGSGSTLIACEKTGRSCFMMEIDPHYCSVIIARWEAFTGEKAELVEA